MLKSMALTFAVLFLVILVVTAVQHWREYRRREKLIAHMHLELEELIRDLSDRHDELTNTDDI
jgi:hypothetical protein